ncbi:MAG: MerR family transcriptional regulator, partial [Ferruginibacter sp.]
ENLSGIKAHTLRIWEQRYNFLKPKRSYTNIRFYSNEELKTILNISLLNKYGFKISHIDRMDEGQVKENILTLVPQEAQQERQVNELVKEMINLDIKAFENILDNFILARGIEKAITQLIFPFMEKIGILWLTNHINPAQEHLVSNLIRQKLIVGIEGIHSSFKINKTMLLFLPEGEHHEIGLLFIHFLVKSRGLDVIYLGTDVPMKDVEYIVNLKNPDYLFSHLTTMGSNFSFEKFLVLLKKKFPDREVILSGQVTQRYEKKILPPVYLKKSLHELMLFITGLK